MLRRLGEYLGCPRAVIEEALRRAGPGRGRLGEVLVSSDIITADALARALRSQRVDRLRSCGIFSHVPAETLGELAPLVTEVSVDTGEQFIFQDRIEPYFFVLISGRVLIYRTDETGKEVIFNSVGPGEPIGESGYFAEGQRSASARAIEPCELLRLDYADLSKCFELAPELALGLLDEVTDRLRRQTLMLEDSAHDQWDTKESLRHLSEFLILSESTAFRAGIEELILQMVYTASKVMRAERATLFLLDPAAGELWSMVAEGEEKRHEVRVPATSGVAGWVVEHGEIVNIRDAYEDERFNPTVDQLTDYRTRTVLCGPVRSLQGEIVGVVQVINKQAGYFDKDDERLFKAFCHQTSIAVGSYKLYSKLMEGHRRMAAMLEIATAVGNTLDIGALIQNVVEKLTEILECDRASFFVLDRDTEELWSMEAHGSELKEIRFHASMGLAGHVATTGETLRIADAYQDQRFSPNIDKATGYRTKSILCSPVRNRNGEIIGVTQAINKLKGEFDEEDARLAGAVSSQIAVAVENAKLYASTLDMKNYLQSVQQSISNAILTLDEDSRVITANRAALELLECAEPACLGRDIRTVLGPANQVLVEALARVSSSREALDDYDVSYTSPSGRAHNVNVHVFELTGHDGVSQGLVLVLEDITQEMRVKSTLTRYMAKELVEQMLSQPDRQGLGGVRSKASVLFSDIRDFTTICEGLTAEATMEFLNEYFTLMVDEVFNQQGVLDKFMGDALMAVFGVPFRRDDDAIRAVRTALNMSHTLERFNESRRERNLPAVHIGIGINTGEIISGNMGSVKRMEYTVIGDEVNVSSRLEGLNKAYGTDILITESTQRDLGEEFVTREMDVVRVKGRVQPVKIFHVLGERGHPLTAEQQCFESGYQAYRERRFETACREFRAGAPNDPPCRVFLERCETFLSAPPEANWDGVWVARNK